MVEQETTRRYYEDLIMDKLWKLSEAKEEGSGPRFDELLDEIESFIKPFPELYQNFVATKEQLEVLAAENKKEIEIKARAISEEITRDLVVSDKHTNIDWEFRTDMLEVVIVMLVEYQMIPFERPIVGEVEYGELTEEQQHPPVDEEYVEPPVPQSIPEQAPYEEGQPIAPPQDLVNQLEEQERQLAQTKKPHIKRTMPRPE